MALNQLGLNADTDMVVKEAQKTATDWQDQIGSFITQIDSMKSEIDGMPETFNANATVGTYLDATEQNLKRMSESVSIAFENLIKIVQGGASVHEGLSSTNNIFG